MASRVRSVTAAYHAPAKKNRAAPAGKKTAPKRRKTSGPRNVQRDEPIVAKLFANGRSQAVRLPKEFRLPGTEVRISREGNRVILEPIGDEAVDANGWRIGFWEEMDRLRKGVNLDEYQVPDDPVPPPIKSMDAP
jgi:antitoxin VapB